MTVNDNPLVRRRRCSPAALKPALPFIGNSTQFLREKPKNGLFEALLLGFRLLFDFSLKNAPRLATPARHKNERPTSESETWGLRSGFRFCFSSFPWSLTATRLVRPPLRGARRSWPDLPATSVPQEENSLRGASGTALDHERLSCQFSFSRFSADRFPSVKPRPRRCHTGPPAYRLIPLHLFAFSLLNFLASSLPIISAFWRTLISDRDSKAHSLCRCFTFSFRK